MYVELIKAQTAGPQTEARRLFPQAADWTTMLRNERDVYWGASRSSVAHKIWRRRKSVVVRKKVATYGYASNHACSDKTYRLKGR